MKAINLLVVNLTARKESFNLSSLNLLSMYYVQSVLIFTPVPNSLAFLCWAICGHNPKQHSRFLCLRQESTYTIQAGLHGKFRQDWVPHQLFVNL